MQGIKEKLDNLVIVQRPNWQISIAFAFWLADFLIFGETASNYLRVGFYITLIFWAYDEVLTGINLIRKAMGVAAIVYVAIDMFNRINSSL